jgi:hypothetical protein
MALGSRLDTGQSELVLDKAEHSVFTERALPGEKKSPSPNHHGVILALSTAFWDAYLRKDQVAKQWLGDEGPQGAMESSDLWQRK